MTPELIEQVLEESAKAHPIRVFVGYNSEPLYPAGRAELALEELERTGRSTAPICRWCPRPGPVGWTRP